MNGAAVAAAAFCLVMVFIFVVGCSVSLITTGH